MLNQELFKNGMIIMQDAFRCYQIQESTFKIYWEYLKDFTDQEFEICCEEIILKERFFPAISVFHSIKNDTSQKYEGLVL